MKNKKSSKTKPEPETEIVEGFVERNVDTPEQSGASRLTLHIAGDGSVDWERTKADADEVIAVVANDPTLLEKVAAHPDFQDDPSSPINPDSWQPSDGAIALEALSKIEGFILHFFSKQILGMKVDLKHSMSAFTMTEEEHQHQDALAARVMDQFLTIDPKWKPLTMLATAHSATVVRAAREACEKQMELGDVSVQEEVPKPGPVIVKPN